MRRFRKLPPLKALHAFEAAARHSSFSLAAAELALTQGAISYQVKQLERRLGARLFDRHTRRVELTPDGRGLYRAVHRAFTDLDDEIGRIFPGHAASRLTVAVSTYFVTRWLSPRLGRFLNAHPGMSVRLHHAVNDPDFAIGDVELAVRWGKGRWPGAESELLFALPMIMVCAPALLEGPRALGRLEDVRRQTLLRDQFDLDLWPEWLDEAGLGSVNLADEPVIVDPNVRVLSAIDGHGLVLANPLVQPEIDAGHLAEPFDIRLHGYGYYLLWKQGTGTGQPFRLFHDWLRAESER